MDSQFRYMEITYQHANPHSGNESFLLRIREKHEARTPCILVDAGDGVDAGELLGDDEYLAAILLTHAHVDHYRSLDDAHRDRAPILTSPGTAAIVEDVFAEGKRHYGLSETEALLGHVEGIDGWRDVVAGTVRVHPVPAGHAPGACGFLVEVGDEDPFHALVTGDFTCRDAGGYPGFEPENYFDIDAVFLTAATNDDFEDELTETVGTLVQRASEGSTTLCTTSGLTGVHLATLLAGVERDTERAVRVILAGQVAKLYDRLGYDHDNVETVPTYSDPKTCLNAGAVTIAGPEVPVEGSSARLFRAIEEDPNATLVQVQGGNTDAKDSGDAKGTVFSTMFTNHPSEDVLDDVVDAISPIHVVVEHQHGRATERYKDKWDAYTWANGDATEQTLFRDGSIVAPPWVGEKTHSRVRGREQSRTVAASNDGLLEQLSLPEIGRRDQIDLAAEGVDVKRLRKRLRTGRPAPETTSQPTPNAEASGSSGGERRATVADGGLYETTGPAISEQKRARVTVDTGDVDQSEELFDTVSPQVALSAEADMTNDSAPESVDTAPEPTPKDDVNTYDEDGTDAGERLESVTGSNESTGSIEADERGEPKQTREETTEEPIDNDGASEQSVSGVRSSAAMESGADDATTVEIDPVVRSLAAEYADDCGTTIDAVVADAVEELLAAVLRGDNVHIEPDAPATTIDADSALEQVIEQSMADDADVSTFVRRALYKGLGIDPEARTISVAGFDTFVPLVDAIAENDDSAVTDPDQIVQVALEHHLTDQ